MINFLRKHKVLTILSSIALALVLIAVFAGRAIGNAAIEQYSQFRDRNKTVCTVNPKNGTQIEYEGTLYQILNKPVPDAQLGGWNGVFRKIAVLDGQCRVLKEVKADVDSASQVAELKKHLPQGAKYVVTYFTVFSIKKTDEHSAVAVGLDKGMFQAVPVSKVTKNEPAVQFRPDN